MTYGQDTWLFMALPALIAASTLILIGAAWMHNNRTAMVLIATGLALFVLAAIASLQMEIRT